MPAQRRARPGPLPLVWLLALFLGSFWGAWLTVGLSSAAPAPAPADAQAGWGSDHVGSPVPEYTTGDECLFCHRDNFGNQWSRNAHQRTVRPVDPATPEMVVLKSAADTRHLADEVEFVLGERRQVRFLKRTGEYGKLALLSASFAPPPPGTRSRRVHGTMLGAKDSHWDDKTFAQSCAGCHTTAVDPKLHAFSAVSLDCFTCHGILDPKHSEDTKRVYFGKGRHDPPRVVAAICGQCHLRNGKSRSTGLPYPTNFVAGDNLFRDFEVGLADADLAAMNPADRHVAENVRDSLQGKTQTSCTTCHDVHRQSTAKHRQIAEASTCATCHEPGKPKSQWKRYEAHSALCRY